MRFSEFTSLRVLVVGATFMLGACSYGDNLLWPADEEQQTQAQPAEQQASNGEGKVPVSYTHLTLPTIYSV